MQKLGVIAAPLKATSVKAQIGQDAGLELAAQQQEAQWLGHFQSFFIGLLPIHNVLRLVDCFLSEGRKIFYRFGIAMLRMHKRVLRDSGGGNGDNGFESIQSKEGWWSSLDAFANGQEFDFDATLALGFALQLKRVQISQVAQFVRPKVEQQLSSPMPKYQHSLTTGVITDQQMTGPGRLDKDAGTHKQQENTQYGHIHDASSLSYQLKLTILPCAESDSPNTPIKVVAKSLSLGNQDQLSRSDMSSGDGETAVAQTKGVNTTGGLEAREEKQISEQKEEAVAEEAVAVAEEAMVVAAEAVAAEAVAELEGGDRYQQNMEVVDGEKGQQGQQEMVQHHQSEGGSDACQHVDFMPAYMPRLLHPMRDTILSTWLPRTQQVREKTT
jgi:hypothetical protein